MILLWGSNARETHPIFFHHVLKGIHNGAKLYVMDPRRTSSAQWADTGSALTWVLTFIWPTPWRGKSSMPGLANTKFIQHATSGFEAYKTHVQKYTLEHAECETGVPAAAITQVAHAYAGARPRPALLDAWNHRASQRCGQRCGSHQPALLTGHVGRYGSGVCPLRGQNNVQGGGDMGAIPDRLPGFQHVENDALRAKFEKAWGMKIPAETKGWHISDMLDAMERGELTTLYCPGRKSGRLRS